MNGTDHLLVFAHVDPTTGTVLARVLLTGAVFGGGMNRQEYGGVIQPLQAVIACTPGLPCAPLSFQTDYFAIAPRAFEPPDPCGRQEVTGALTRTFGADGTVVQVHQEPQPIT